MPENDAPTLDTTGMVTTDQGEVVGVQGNTATGIRRLPEDSELREFLLETENGIVKIIGMAGCHQRGQGIMMFDGSTRSVEDVQVGDLLMGPDSTPRTVCSLGRGSQDMVTIQPMKGASFTVNQDHVLTLVHSVTGEIIDVTVRDFERRSLRQRRDYKLFRAPVLSYGVEQGVLPVDPYFLGVLLGDGSLTSSTIRVDNPDPEIIAFLVQHAAHLGVRCGVKEPGARCVYTRLNVRTETLLGALGLAGRVAEHKFIPSMYKTASWGDRLQILAGLLDTDGHLDSGSAFTMFDFISKSKVLANDVATLSRSVGLAAYVKPCEKFCQTGAGGTYYRVSISGNTDVIPTRVVRKQARPRTQKKDVLRTGFEITHEEHDDYYGFTLDGDGRYLLDDFTVTHNTGKTTCIKDFIDDCRKAGLTTCVVTPTGKAARRVTEATGYEAHTIHSMLYRPMMDPRKNKLMELRETYEETYSALKESGLSRKELRDHVELKKLRDDIKKLGESLDGNGVTFSYNPREELTEAQIVFIDEASMVGENLAKDLLAAVTGRIVAVGDVNQLPPVKDEPWFHQLPTTAELTEVYRQAEGSGILKLAMDVMNGVSPDPLNGYGDDVNVEWGTPTSAQLASGDFDHIVVGKNATRRSFNLQIREARGLSTDPVSKWKPAENEPMIVLQNTVVGQTVSFMNGDLVYLREISRGRDNRGRPVFLADVYDSPAEDATRLVAQVTICEDALRQTYEPDYMPRYGGELKVDFAHALTAHKMQGSEGDRILVQWEPIGRGDDRVKWCYTAVTRAKKHLTIFKG